MKKNYIFLVELLQMEGKFAQNAHFLVTILKVEQ